jgi:hypothetical protein
MRKNPKYQIMTVKILTLKRNKKEEERDKITTSTMS